MKHPMEYMDRILKILIKRFDGMDSRFDQLESKVDNISNPKIDPDKKPLDNEDVQRLLKISERTLQRYKKEKILPYSKIKGKSYFKKSDVLELLKNRI